MELQIRRATPADRGALLAFHYGLYMDHRQKLVPEELWILGAYKDMPSTLRGDVDALLNLPDKIALLAVRDGMPVGYATGRVELEPHRELPCRGIVEDWYVDEAVRGEGIGRKLLDQLLEEFRAEGCEVAESTTWPSNEGALRGHRAAGFQDVEVKLRRRL